MILPSVFVQIPTQNENYVSSSRANTVRRHDEIKAEPPIKSEIDAAIQRSNKDTQRTSSPSQSKSLTANLVTARPKVKCFKCEQCPFMSISQDGYNNHMVTVHNDRSDDSTPNRTKILCPGCENIFYSKMSLKIHLVDDHQMSRSDISQLLESLFVKKPNDKDKRVQSQKIYLKNVEVLLDSEVAGEFGVQETPPPMENPSPSTDDLTNNDSSNFDRIRSTYNQMDNSCLYQQITNVEYTSAAQNNNRIHSPSVDDPNAQRPDSENSVKFSENFVDTSNSWPPITSVGSFSSYHTPSPPVVSVCQNEKKKIYIKNIDILKEPLIKPAQIANVGDPCFRKNTLHLRTVDEVNLLINRQHENSNFNSSNTITLNEDDYRYVLNEATDYNNIIPQYLDSNDVNNFDLFSSESITVANTNEYFNTANTNYSITNLDSSSQTFIDGNSIISFDSSTDTGQPNQSAHERNQISSFGLPNSDGFLINGSDGYSDGFFANKYLPNDQQCMLLGDQCVSSEAIIDILDLTNDVEQIFDDNLINQEFDGLSYDSNSNGKCMGKFMNKLSSDGCTWLDGLAKMNVATDLEQQKDGKSFDMRPLETPTINLEPAEEVIVKAIDITIPTPITKKKSGRTKGARQKIGIESRNSTITTKCSINNCGMRFATETALQLHEQCHSVNGILCPKCEIDATSESNKTARNWNWNTLHTHLWREHSIDMELYSCPHCTFKTPILSRLKNTHMRIHSDEKDFKCDFCPKAFKNARQMKNHRRIHTRTAPPTISQCKYCRQSFLSAKHLKEHYFTHTEAAECQPLQCDICSETFSSKHALRTHHLSHFQDKRFTCDYCDYKSNDHNAFRRHQMVHSKQMKYKCPCCTFECIQSTNYKNHVLKKHPDAAKEIMFMCDKCSFITVNKRMYDMHCLNNNHRLAVAKNDEIVN